ncbi:hypothetical protein RFI_16008 [Reticulomyxa filosa]|uniref:Uncharacterized protein n=1 Tax=Reticulomyxa filosa TaxID=46433 RepID=X6N4H4_RETFI|nr:hypothetical protein RFI_16008 [Reticulomyxa filosa]|eukprot:ETO21195.1 hypothetical protein RFI_16008 [Reticulomyxa filosa]
MYSYVQSQGKNEKLQAYCVGLLWYMLFRKLEHEFYHEKWQRKNKYVFSQEFLQELDKKQSISKALAAKTIGEPFQFPSDVHSSREEEILFLQLKCSNLFSREKNKKIKLGDDKSEIESIFDNLIGIEKKFDCEIVLPLKKFVLECLCFHPHGRYKPVYDLVQKHGLNWNIVAKIWYQNQPQLTFHFLMGKVVINHEPQNITNRIQNIRPFLFDKWSERCSLQS